MARTVGSTAEGSRALIVAAALELFAARTYAGTSLRDIAERVGMSKAALYYHFPSKEALLVALLGPTVERFARLIDDATDIAGTVDRLRLIEQLVDVQCEHFAIVTALQGDPSVRTVLWDHFGFDRIITDVTRALTGPGRITPAKLMQARCAVGAISWSIRITAQERAHDTSHSSPTTAKMLSATDRRVIIASAAAVLKLT